MPANLPPQYFEAEKRFRLAKTPTEKIEALEIMLAIMPKHKGTDKLRAELRRKIAKFSEEAEKKYALGRHGIPHIKKEGAGQVVLLGLPNTGKSQLLAAVTEASPDIADYPFTTTMPTPGMMDFENIKIQLIDTPPITERGLPPWLTNLLRNTDLIAILVDLSLEPVAQVETVIQELRKFSIGLLGSQDQPPQVRFWKKAIIVGNKVDLDSQGKNWSKLIQYYQKQFPLVAIAAKNGTGLDEFKNKIYQALDIIRVYTKVPGGKPDLTEPIVLKKGSIVEDAAEAIHKDFKNKLKYALIWGSGKFNGQRVKRGHVLEDGDIIEFHI